MSTPAPEAKRVIREFLGCLMRPRKVQFMRKPEVDIKDLRDRLERLSEEVTPEPDSRLSAGCRPLDFRAPSAWHAAALLLAIANHTTFFHADEAPPPEALEEAFYGNRLIFRGQTAPWPMLASALRVPVQATSNREAIRRACVAIRSALTHEIAASDEVIVSSFFAHPTLLDAEAILQHYLNFSLLLDWTFDPLVALWFATQPSKGARPPEPCVYFFSFRKAIAFGGKVAFPPKN